MQPEKGGAQNVIIGGYLEGYRVTSLLPYLINVVLSSCSVHKHHLAALQWNIALHQLQRTPLDRLLGTSCLPFVLSGISRLVSIGSFSCCPT
jgi:hypothetical protein